jgi:hypothetical protein
MHQPTMRAVPEYRVYQQRKSDRPTKIWECQGVLGLAPTELLLLEGADLCLLPLTKEKEPKATIQATVLISVSISNLIT